MQGGAGKAGCVLVAGGVNSVAMLGATPEKPEHAELLY